MGNPNIYGDRTVNGTAEEDSTATLSDGTIAQEAERRSSLTVHRDGEDSPDKVPSTIETKPAPEPTNIESRPANPLSYGLADLADSASAVDDDIWRKFELAEEYYLMGVMANREASWEEAQYYFERGLRILAKLDIEADSAFTPEAVQYTRLLDNFVADYRSTLRSLGHLESDVSSSVLVERFSNISEGLGSDSLHIYKQEVPREITYDLPVVMNDRVRSSIAYFQTVAHDAFVKYLQRSQKYTPMMSRIIAEYGLPQDLIYLSLIESGYNPNAYSWARAMGLWQFISSTGRMYKLDRNWWMDERKDPIKATHAACQFLRDLYKQFGDWELAMAAYNGGPGRVSRTIKKMKTDDFWQLQLKRQTMDYVPLIYAAAIIAKEPEKYGFTDIVFEPEIVWEEVEIDRCLELKVVAQEVGCSVQELQVLNPELLRKFTPPNIKSYRLKIPVGSKSKFLAAYDGMPSPKETSWVKHKIRSGETVSTIAAKYGVSQYAVFEANNLSQRSRIFAGKELIVPVPLDREYKASSPRKPGDYKSSNSIYVVRSGDTMWDIARAFGTTVNAIRSNNYIERGSRIYVGQKIKIPSSASQLAQKNNKSSSPKYAGTQPSGSAKTSKDPHSHTVRSGDTIWDIARKYGTTTSKIRNLNSLGRSSRIYPGQVLKVNGDQKYVVHEVRRGDTLSRIAEKYRVSVSRIISANDIRDPDELAVGENLKIYTK